MAKSLYDASLINSTLLEMLETQGYSDYTIALKLAIEKINAKVIATNGIWTKKKLQDIKNLIEIEITKSYGGLFDSVAQESVSIAQVTYASILGADLALELPTEAVENLLDPKLKVRMSQPFTNKKDEGKTGVYTLAKLFGVEEQSMIRRMQIAVASGITASDSVAKIIKGVEFEGSKHRGGRLRSNIFTMVTNARNEGNYSAYRDLEDDDVIKYYEHNSTLDVRTCIAKGQKVNMSDGSYKNIEDVKSGDEIITHTNKKAKVKYSEHTGNKKVIRITLKDGRTITGTEDHKIWNGKQWKTIGKMIKDMV